ncbi:MAG: class I SAM-dependent methyltransferase [Erysipelotrichaceae bacterium]|nr:class I SAM-dependent methyltransferase [Erysipelotrichaceae bacterium]
MSTRQEIINDLYSNYDEDTRTIRSRHGQLEYRTTMNYVHRYAKEGSKILELGAGTGRYSIALAKEGMDVTAVELTEANLATLRRNSKGLKNLAACQGDATDLSRFQDGSFDLTLSFGPMYHLYEANEVNRAIDEAIRVTRPGGVIMFAFISIYAVMYSDYFYGHWTEGQKMNFDKDNRVCHFKEQLFTGYDITEFEDLFKGKDVEWITTAGVDGLLEPIEERSDFALSDEDFDAMAEWYLSFCEKRELLGMTNHLLYICRKRNR